MKTLKIFVITILTIIMLSNNGIAQCKEFVSKNVLAQLAPFKLEGNINTTNLKKGESTEILKNFQSGKSYKLIAYALGENSRFKLQVLDAMRNSIYETTTTTNSTFYEISPKDNQMLIIKVSILNIGGYQDNTETCLALLFGVK